MIDIIKQFPKLFSSDFVLECNSGWSKLIQTLCFNIQSHINHTRSSRAYALKFNRSLDRSNKDNTKPKKYLTVNEACQQVKILQIKEKFGYLRVYYVGGDDVVYGMIRVAESFSANICEMCGNPAEVHTHNGWILTRCSGCKNIDSVLNLK